MIWLNPLAGADDYEPLTQGMRAAAPYVDDLLPVHNLAALADLARHLNRLDSGRPVRRQRHAEAPETAAARQAQPRRPPLRNAHGTQAQTPASATLHGPRGAP